MGIAAKGSATTQHVNDYFRRWDYDGTLDRIHHALYSGYQGPKFQEGLGRLCAQINVEIVKRSDIGFRHSAQTVDRRADDRLAQPLSSSDEGLGMPQSEWPRIPALGIHPLDDGRLCQETN